MAPIPWILPPPSNSRVFIIWICRALSRSPSIDCYCMGAVQNLSLCLLRPMILGLRERGFRARGNYQGLGDRVLFGLRVLDSELEV